MQKFQLPTLINEGQYRGFSPAHGGWTGENEEGFLPRKEPH